MSRTLILYTRAGCGLCDELVADAQPIVERHGAVIRRVDIDQDRDLRRRYGWDIPVLLLDGEEICRHRLNPDALERALKNE